MIFIDSNIPMYIIGADHPLKGPARRLLERAISQRERLVTDAEVYQEVLHRYSAINRREAIPAAFDLLDRAVDEVLPIEPRDVYRAKDLLLSSRKLSARDALHAAVMEHHKIRRLMSFDTGYDGLPGIERLTA
ncbi:MAG TPA: type II toxin-antitoxin system VapC family toxin [Thermoanaerobaculia bacterium]|nr:type II toxin-antitoxin system VapC family toxin [Thermoanaerobaculia bacterium]